MQFYARISISLVALAFFSILFSSTALAQGLRPVAGDAPSLSRQMLVAGGSVAAPAEPKASVALRPILPPSAAALASTQPPVGGYARLIPTAPRVVARPGGGLLAGNGYRAQLASRVALKVNSAFGYRRHPITGLGHIHTGIDLEGAHGESVGASAAGTVVFASVKGGYGNLVIIDHGGAITSYYAHLSAFNVSVGDVVAAGQIVGFVGSTGRSTGPHLHYEVRAHGRPLDPFAAITINGAQVYANGRPVTGPAVGEGDVVEAPAAKQKVEDVKPVLVAGEGSLTSY